MAWHGKKPTMNELSRCSYPISSCPIWSEVGRIKVFTCMLKVRTMSDTIRNSNFLLHVNVLTKLVDIFLGILSCII